MSYKTLYRKYRPKNFSDVVGQEHIISTLKNIIENDKISHAYLFSGPRGTGKTSVAKIFSQKINKDNNVLLDNVLDIIEIDAASNNGVSEIRNLIENSYYAPNKSKYKVYIIDEVHMLTKGAFNALLKTLEEPSKHLIFILATTEPHRIPTTILSRTQRFNFHRIQENVIFEKLKIILQKENVIFEEEAIKYIAKLAQGSMRDALSIADQAAAYGKSNITFAAISQVFGIISVENQIKILNLSFLKKTKELLNISNQFIDNGIDIERLTSSLIDVCKEFIIYKKTNDESLLNILSKNNFLEINFNLDFSYEAMEILVKIVSDLKYSDMPRQIFELTLLKLIKINKEKENNIEHNIKNDNLKDNLETNEINLKIDSANENIQNIFNSNDKTNDLINVENNKINTENNQDINIQNEKINKESNLDFLFEESDKSINIFDKKNKENYINFLDVINLLVQANKEKSQKFKKILKNILEKINEVDNKEYISLIKDFGFISGGNNFILLGSENIEIINHINNERNNPKFIGFINQVFGTPLHVFAITKEQFLQIKKEWKKLSITNNLPNPKELPKIDASQIPKSDAEKLGEKLFGNVFG